MKTKMPHWISNLALILMLSAGVGMVTIPMDNVAFAKNGGNGNGGGKGGGKGESEGKKSEGKGGQGKTSQGSSSSTKNSKKSVTSSPSKKTTKKTAYGAGKLNGFLHASPTALKNASPNSALGKVTTEVKEALANYAAGTATIDDVAKALAAATNKPVTARQVSAVIDKLESITDDGSLDAYKDGTLDKNTVSQEIAEKTNDIKNGTSNGATTTVQ